jgi:hypothetical protein
MLNPQEALLVADLFYSLDSAVRHGLHRTLIADERDYISQLVTHCNYPNGIFNSYSFNGIRFKSDWFAKVNSGHDERLFGCDSMIVFKVDNNIKVGLFEGKWPRIIIEPNYPWDYPQKKTKQSHFTSQIERQANWTNQAAIWEMFCYEDAVGNFNSPFDRKASTCIKHQFAKSLINKTPSLQVMWNNEDLITLIQSAQSPKFDGENETNLRTIVFDILTCNFGTAKSIEPNEPTFTLVSNKEDISIDCPILILAPENSDLQKSNEQKVEGFMQKTGLSFFQQLDIIPPNSEGR